MNFNHLLVLLPQLHLLADELDSAVQADDKLIARRALVGYSRAASQVASLLTSAANPDDDDLIEKLRESAASAGSAKSLLVNGTTKSLSTVVKTVSGQISDIANTVSELMTTYQAKVS